MCIRDRCGSNPHTGIASYGNSMAVGPWGDVLGRIEEGETTMTVTLNKHDLENTRRRIPALAHRKL